MVSWDDDLPKPKPAITVGEKLDRLSIAELDERIEALKAEITRVESEREAKRAFATAAAALFDK
jgi:uncharacterized small protein (DUF1192 family)